MDRHYSPLLSPTFPTLPGVISGRRIQKRTGLGCLGQTYPPARPRFCIITSYARSRTQLVCINHSLSSATSFRLRSRPPTFFQTTLNTLGLPFLRSCLHLHLFPLFLSTGILHIPVLLDVRISAVGGIRRLPECEQPSLLAKHPLAAALSYPHVSDVSLAITNLE